MTSSAEESPIQYPLAPLGKLTAAGSKDFCLQNAKYATSAEDSGRI